MKTIMMQYNTACAVHTILPPDRFDHLIRTIRFNTDEKQDLNVYIDFPDPHTAKFMLVLTDFDLDHEWTFGLIICDSGPDTMVVKTQGSTHLDHETFCHLMGMMFPHLEILTLSCMDSRDINDADDRGQWEAVLISSIK